MSAPEDSTTTAQPAAPEHHQHNVVSAASTSSASALTAAVGGGTVATASPASSPANAGSPTVVTTLNAPAVTTAVDKAAGAPTATLPSSNGSNSITSTSVKEGTGSTTSNTTGPEGSSASGGSVALDAADAATSSCDSEKATSAAPVTAATVSSSPLGTADDAGAAAATSDSFASIEVGSSGGTSTPLAAASPASLTGGDAVSAKAVPSLSGCGSLLIASSAVVPNGEGESAAGVPVLSGTAASLPLRGRDVADKHSLEYHCRMIEDELQSVKESEAKYKQQYSESQRRERILARRVAVQEQEMRDYSKQIAELKSAQAPGPAALRSALLDPAVNILFQKLKAELQATKAKLEETQNELSAWKFTPDSNTGKRLMAKCRLLYQENEELGKMTSNGRLAKLESELALQKSYNEEVKKSQLELDDFLQELDEDVEGMQSTIVFLQQELKQTKDARDEAEKELLQLRSYIAANLGPFSGSGNNPTSGSTPTDERNSSMMMMMDGQDSNSNSHGHDAYHHPDGGGPDSIGGTGSSNRLGELGGGVTPIYLVNGDGGGGGVVVGSGTVVDTGSRLVNKSSSSGDDQDMMVYSNRTHCGGVVTNSNELRTTPASGAAVGLSAAAVTASAAATAATSSLSALLPGTVSDNSTAAVNGGVSAAIAAGSGAEPLVNALQHQHHPRELSGSVAGSEGNRTSGSNTDSNSGGIVTDAGNSVNSTKQPHHPQQQPPQQQPQPQQQQQQRTSNNVGRNGGRTTVAARKRNYNETEVDSTDQADAGGGVAGSESVVDGVTLVMDVVGAESSATSGVANGKLSADGSLLPEQQQQQQQDVDSNSSNKRMTRSGKGKAAAATASAAPASATTTATSSSSSSSTSSSSSASNVLMTSAAKKLRRGSIAPDDEVDPLGDAQPSPQQQPSQPPISSANGSN